MAETNEELLRRLQGTLDELVRRAEDDQELRERLLEELEPAQGEAREIWGELFQKRRSIYERKAMEKPDQ
jgi:hypothetical protein